MEWNSTEGKKLALTTFQWLPGVISSLAFRCSFINPLKSQLFSYSSYHPISKKHVEKQATNSSCYCWQRAEMAASGSVCPKVAES